MPPCAKPPPVAFVQRRGWLAIVGMDFITYHESIQGLEDLRCRIQRDEPRLGRDNPRSNLLVRREQRTEGDIHSHLKIALLITAVTYALLSPVL